MTITAMPSSAASGSSSRSTSRSCGLYGSCTTSKRRVRSASASSPNALRRVVRHAELVDPSLPPAPPRATRAARASATRLWICSISTRPNHSRCRRYCSRPSSTESAQIFVAHGRLVAAARERRARATPRRRGTSARSRRRACRPRAPRRRPRRASAASEPNVFQVPRPTTGPRRRSSIKPRARRRRARASRRPCRRGRRR